MALAVMKLIVAAAFLADVLIFSVSGGGGWGEPGGSRNITFTPTTPTLPPLADRLQAAAEAMAAADSAGAGGSTTSTAWMAECWGAVTRLGSCTNEIVLFFVNGESYLGADCCLAIRTVTRNCWPAMLSSVGFTVEEADILRGFCDAEVGGGNGGGDVPAAAPAAANSSAVSPAPATATA
uniref:Prolamin-like domain-containing protein n=1 Tax=Leersia perrieri TaxID=77586 RepID=A0A0D9XPG8_9ORYZ